MGAMSLTVFLSRTRNHVKALSKGVTSSNLHLNRISRAAQLENRL